ncbi:MAG: hypothetical protein IJT09_04920 [Abditibacteriota bacterium]|nr:hypothetical protein [Abditibacteriota bacterium]
MPCRSANLITRTLDAAKIACATKEHGRESVVAVPCRLADNTEITVCYLCGGGSNRVTARCWLMNVAKSDSLPELYALCNKCNGQYGFLKFYEESGTVVVDCDIPPVADRDLGSAAYGVLVTFTTVLSKVYVDFEKICMK